MANFNEAIDKVLKSEGLYSNDPDDNGGETFRGISRKANPKWIGWEIVDSYKVAGKNFKNKIQADRTLLRLSKEFYKLRYWDCFDLDNEKNQNIANMIFDMGVNAGVSVARKLYNNVQNKVKKYYK